MKRSQINNIILEAQAFFKENSWALPPDPRWDVTDFGLGDFYAYGLVLVNLADEPEYCEKLMYARIMQKTPAHAHLKKKEDIIVRAGELAVQVWPGNPEGKGLATRFEIQVNNKKRMIYTGETLTLYAGERVTLIPGVFHEFWPLSDQCIIGEVSTANDDLHDNFFLNPNIGRYAAIEEDEPAILKLLSD